MGISKQSKQNTEVNLSYQLLILRFLFFTFSETLSILAGAAARVAKLRQFFSDSAAYKLAATPLFCFFHFKFTLTKTQTDRSASVLGKCCQPGDWKKLQWEKTSIRMCILWFLAVFLSVHVQECCGCVCVCQHLWLQSRLVLRVHVFGFSVQGKKL